MVDGTIPKDYNFQMRATTLGGGETWFGPYTIRILCPYVIKMIGLKSTTSPGGLIPLTASYLVGQDLASGLPTYEWPFIDSELEVCSKVSHYELIPVTPNALTMLQYPSQDCSSVLCTKIDLTDVSATAVIQFRIKAILTSNARVTGADGTDEMPVTDVITLQILDNTALSIEGSLPIEEVPTVNFSTNNIYTALISDPIQSIEVCSGTNCDGYRGKQS